VFFANLRYRLIYISPGLIVVLVLDPLIIFQMIVVIGFMASLYDGLPEEDCILDKSPIEIMPIVRSFFRTGKCRT